LHRDASGPVLGDQIHQLALQLAEALDEGRLLVKPNDPAVHQRRAVLLPGYDVDHAVAGETRAGVQAEDANGLGHAQLRRSLARPGCSPADSASISVAVAAASRTSGLASDSSGWISGCASSRPISPSASAAMARRRASRSSSRPAATAYPRSLPSAPKPRAAASCTSGYSSVSFP